jgi:hypothetical protein
MEVYLVTPTDGDPRVFMHLENAQKYLQQIKQYYHRHIGWIDTEGRTRELLQNEDHSTFALLRTVKVYDTGQDSNQ